MLNHQPPVLKAIYPGAPLKMKGKFGMLTCFDFNDVEKESVIMKALTDFL